MKKYGAVLVLLSCFLVYGCGGIIDYYFLKPKPYTALELLEAGKDALENKDYDRAIEYFQKMKDKYPFSPYTTEAELLLGDSYFYVKKYEEAEETYKDFESLHPGHKRIDYVIFQIGRCNYFQEKSIDLPQQCIKEAISYFTKLVEAFPDSKYVSEAKKYLKKCRYLLAKHEIYVANFYFRTKKYKGAWKRFEFIQNHFSEFKDIVSYAKEMMRISYIKYQMKESKEKRESEMGSWWARFKRWL